MIVELVDRPEVFERLGSPWNELLDSCDNADLMLTHEWVATHWFCEQELNRGTRLNVLLVRDRTELVGIAPLMIRTFLTRGITIRKLCFLHEGAAFNRGDFLMPHRSEEVLETILQYLKKNTSAWDLATFAGVPAESRTVSVLPALAGRCGLRSSSWTDFGEALVLPLTGSWDLFLKRHSSNFRRSLKRSEHILTELGTVDCRTASDPATVRQGLKSIFRFNKDRKKADGVAFTAIDNLSERAHLRVADAFSKKGLAHVKMLRLNGRSIAGIYFILYRRRLYAILTKYDREFAHASPGRTLLHHFIRDEWQHREDATHIDFLNRQPYLGRWVKDSKNTLRIDFFHAGAVSRGIRFTKRYIRPFIANLSRQSLE